MYYMYNIFYIFNLNVVIGWFLTIYVQKKFVQILIDHKIKHFLMLIQLINH